MILLLSQRRNCPTHQHKEYSVRRYIHPFAAILLLPVLLASGAFSMLARSAVGFAGAGPARSRLQPPECPHYVREA